MATITIELVEILNLLEENIDRLPIENAYCDGDYLVGKINPGKFLPNVKVKIRFVDFEDGVLFFIVDTNSAIEWILDFFGYNKEGEFFSIDFPQLYIYINAIIESKVSGVSIKSVTYNNGSFIIES